MPRPKIIPFATELDICILYKQGHSVRSLSEQFGYDRNAIYRIIKKKESRTGKPLRQPKSTAATCPICKGEIVETTAAIETCCAPHQKQLRQVQNWDWTAARAIFHSVKSLRADTH
jgi:hypothetical protein